MRHFLAALALGALAMPSFGAELAVVPADGLITLPARNRGYYDLIVPTILVRAGDGEQLRGVTARIELLRAGKSVLVREVNEADFARDTGGLGEAAVPGFVNGQALNARGLDGLFAKPTVLARSPAVKAGEAVGTFGNAFVTSGPADSVRVTVTASREAGGPVTLEKIIPVAEYRSSIDYRAPVRGTWLMTILPGLRSHHRFNPPSEFAVDLFKADGDGRVWHDDSSIAANFYGFGADVLAAADGVVVSVIDGEIQDRAALTRRPDEAPEAAGRRIQMYNMARYAKDFARAAAGNLVVIRHEREGRTEYSAYGHLRAGIAVKPGQSVKQGERIGSVGDTGDSAAAHLHFQVNSGPDPFTSKSLPVRFNEVRDPSGIDDVMEMVVAK